MKILLGNEELEVIEAASNTVVFTTADSEEEDGDEDEEEDEGQFRPELQPLMYKIKLYKNPQSQNIEKTIRIEAVNMTIQAISELAAVLILVNASGQAVYSVPWDLVHSIDSSPVSPK